MKSESAELESDGDRGIGGGSVTRMLAERVGSTGSVLAVDLDTSLLEELASVEADYVTRSCPGGSLRPTAIADRRAAPRANGSPRRRHGRDRRSATSVRRPRLHRHLAYELRGARPAALNASQSVTSRREP
ncbi:MAG TPA: hypothetical protein VGH93_01355, partial [Solirubrobacteraceae bacterium]